MLAALGLGCVLSALVTLGAPSSVHPDAIALVELVNAARARSARLALVWDAGLARSATWKAHDLDTTQRFSHTDSTGRYVGELLTDCGYGRTRSGWGEALARAYDTPERVLAAWERSEPHGRMLLRPEYRAVGAARDGITWVLHAGGDVDVPLETSIDAGGGP